MFIVLIQWAMIMQEVGKANRKRRRIDDILDAQYDDWDEYFDQVDEGKDGYE
jgi:hypothetical protein